MLCLAACAGAFGADAFLTAPNDTCAGVIPVLLNVPASGTLDSTTNNDYQLSGSTCFTGVGQSASTAAGRDVVYSFTAPAAGNYSFHVLSTGGFGNAVIYLASTCPSGIPPVTVSTCIAAANRSFFSVGADEVLCQPLAANQLVYVFVDDTSASSTSNYRLEVTPCTQETEPNDGTASANGLACPMEGSINPGSDVDFFAFPTTAVDQRVFALADGFAANSTDFDMRVTTTTDTLEFDDLNADGYFGSTSPAIAGTKTTGPNTYIRLNQHVGNASEPYRLYTLLEPPSSQATTETDPGSTGNNSIATANAIGKLYIYGTISTADDDYFSVCAEKGDVIFAAMDCDPGYDNTYINGWLTLFDAAGTTLVNVDDTQATTTSRAPSTGTLTATTPSPPAEALAYQVASTGLYYLRVRSNTTAPSADYLLGVGLNCQPAQADLAVSQTALPNPVRAGNQLTSTIPARQQRRDDRPECQFQHLHLLVRVLRVARHRGALRLVLHDARCGHERDHHLLEPVPAPVRHGRANGFHARDADRLPDPVRDRPRRRGLEHHARPELGQ